MESKIQVVLEGENDWYWYVIREDGEHLDQGGPYPSEYEVQQAAQEEHPDLDFVLSIPQEIWPPQA